jgi:hypothetical protein
LAPAGTGFTFLTPSGGPITAGLGGGKSLLGFMPDSGLFCAFWFEAQEVKCMRLSRMPESKKVRCRKIVSLILNLFR